MLKGKIIDIQHVIVVPFQQAAEGYLCVIVKSRHTSYPVGGYNIYVTDKELEEGQVIDL